MEASVVDQVVGVLCESRSVSNASYYFGNGITFILTDKKTIVHTKHQTFLVKHDHGNYIKRLERLREMIRSGKIISLPDLVTYCQFKPGNYLSLMSGLELVPTKLERHI